MPVCVLSKAKLRLSSTNTRLPVCVLSLPPVFYMST